MDEIYNEDNGGFMGFFQSNKVKKIGSRLDTLGASNVYSKGGRSAYNDGSEGPG
jgi:hypothetical protein